MKTNNIPETGGTTMKYHLEKKRLSEFISLSECGKKINRIRQFIYNDEQFAGHFSKNLQCKKCLATTQKTQKG